jgi:hypothetical protein
VCRCVSRKGSPIQLFFKELQPLDLAFSLKNNLSLQVLNFFGDFDETWYKGRSHCAICRGSCVQLFFKELRPLDLTFSLKNTLSLQLFLNPLGDLDETWYEERLQHVDVHIVSLKNTLSS